MLCVPGNRNAARGPSQSRARKAMRDAVGLHGTRIRAHNGAVSLDEPMPGDEGTRFHADKGVAFLSDRTSVTEELTKG